MKIFIAVDNNNGMDSLVGERFGRAGYFLIYDMAEDKILSMQENAYKDDAQGVGTRVAAMVIEKGCSAVIGAQPGPKAADILAKAGIKMLVADKGTAREAIQHFRPQLEA